MSSPTSLFDGPDRLYLSQRGGLTGSYDYSIFAKLEKPVVRRYAWNDSDKRWSEDVGEFAVGLKLPHRSTLGGIALSYGYDADGKIDYGKCRETLWTTGEHLREGDDKERASRAARASCTACRETTKAISGRPTSRRMRRGLSTMTASSTTPTCTAASAISRSTLLAIAVDCRRPPSRQFPSRRPPTVRAVWIKKVCTPAPFGGLIHCVITVTNSGSTPRSAGHHLGCGNDPRRARRRRRSHDHCRRTRHPAVVVHPTPTANLSCTLAPELLPPGASHSIDVTIDTGPLFLAGNHGFRNCAVLRAPWYGEACADGGRNLTVMKTAPAACAPGADCTFGVTITNNGSLAIQWRRLAERRMFMGPGAALPAPITIAPPLGCVPAPAAVPFSCGAAHPRGWRIVCLLHHGDDALGPAPGYWARNCIAVSAPGVAPPALPPPSRLVDKA